jgi:hypothetical protein
MLLGRHSQACLATPRRMEPEPEAAPPPSFYPPASRGTARSNNPLGDGGGGGEPQQAGPEQAEVFEPDPGRDHIVWAFFRLGQYWLSVLRAPTCEPECYLSSGTETRSLAEEGYYADGQSLQGGPYGNLPPRTPGINCDLNTEQARVYDPTRFVIILRNCTDEHCVFRLSGRNLPQLQSAQHKYLLLHTNPERSKQFSILCSETKVLDPVSAEETKHTILRIWSKDKPFHQQWHSVDLEILAVPADDTLFKDHPAALTTDDSCGHFVQVRRTGAFRLFGAFFVALVPLALQCLLSYHLWTNSESVDVAAVAQWIEAADAEYRPGPVHLSSFDSAEEYKLAKKQYTVGIHDLFSTDSHLCLTDQGLNEAKGNVRLGTLIIQLLLIWEAYQFWAVAPMNLATYSNNRELAELIVRWVGFLILFGLMVANYAFLIMSCFYAILGKAEDFPGMLGDSTMAFFMLQLDDVIFWVAAQTIFRADLSACPGTSAYQTFQDHCRHVDFKWCEGCGEISSCGKLWTRVGNCVVKLITPIVALCVLVLPWAPALCHTFVFEHGFLGSQHRCAHALMPPILINSTGHGH